MELIVVLIAIAAIAILSQVVGVDSRDMDPRYQAPAL